MTTKHQPAAPLPWHSAHESVKGPHRRRVVNAAINSCGIQAAYQDAAYVAHAANAYPSNVAFINRVAHWQPSVDDERLAVSTLDRAIYDARALLRELGEE